MRTSAGIAGILQPVSGAEVRCGSKMRKSYSEHFSTAVPQKAVVLTAANGSFVP